MGAIPSGAEPEHAPPTALPLRHFLVGLALLVGAGVLGVLAVGGGNALAHVHLALAGWICLTIMGAMTQFVPVWSGVRLRSRRLAGAALRLVTVGIAGFAAALLAGRPGLLAVPAVVMAAGFWTFAYNVGRTLAAARPLDATERHFALALCFLVAATGLGAALALDLAVPFLDRRGPVVGAHAALAVFGAVLTAVMGAIYQLAPMFASVEPDGADAFLRRVGETLHAVGVVALAGGRLAGSVTVAGAGGLLVAVGVIASVATVARTIAGARSWSPVLSRYAVFVLAAVPWALSAIPAWVERPLDRAALLGAPGTGHLLLLGAGFVVLGTLYHVVPFLVWLDRYADRVGRGAVPAVDDLYRGDVERADLAATATGGALVVLGEVAALPGASAAGGIAATLGFALAALNLLRSVREHAPGGVAGAFGR